MAEYKVVLSFQKISHPEMLIVNGVTALGYIQIHRVLARLLEAHETFCNFD